MRDVAKLSVPSSMHAPDAKDGNGLAAPPLLIPPAGGLGLVEPLGLVPPTRCTTTPRR